MAEDRGRGQAAQADSKTDGSIGTRAASGVVGQSLGRTGEELSFIASKVFGDGKSQKEWMKETVANEAQWAREHGASDREAQLFGAVRASTGLLSRISEVAGGAPLNSPELQQMRDMAMLGVRMESGDRVGRMVVSAAEGDDASAAQMFREIQSLKANMGDIAARGGDAAHAHAGTNNVGWVKGGDGHASASAPPAAGRHPGNLSSRPSR
jgi:hypothetical protein